MRARTLTRARVLPSTGTRPRPRPRREAKPRRDRDRDANPRRDATATATATRTPDASADVDVNASRDATNIRGSPVVRPRARRAGGGGGMVREGVARSGSMGCARCLRAPRAPLSHEDHCCRRPSGGGPGTLDAPTSGRPRAACSVPNDLLFDRSVRSTPCRLWSEARRASPARRTIIRAHRATPTSPRAKASPKKKRAPKRSEPEEEASPKRKRARRRSETAIREKRVRAARRR